MYLTRSRTFRLTCNVEMKNRYGRKARTECVGGKRCGTLTNLLKLSLLVEQRSNVREERASEQGLVDGCVGSDKWSQR
jgi:hypothetical protein